MADEIKIGIITDCKAGLNLAEKFIDKKTDFSICGFFDKGTEESEDFMQKYTEVNNRTKIDILMDLDALILSLKKPRVLLVVGRNYTREHIKLFSEKLESGDIIIDCCDVNYKESAMISKQLLRNGINYLGTGYVFATENLFTSPAFMFSGNIDAYNTVFSAFSEISSYIDGVSCASYIGPDGSGQFVKMVCTSLYNTFLELIAETIFLIRYTLNLSPYEIKDILIDFSSSEASSFLLDTAADIICKKDAKTDKFMVDVALDRIVQSKRDIWIAKYAYDLGCPIPTVTAASNIRLLSGFISERISASQLIEIPEADKIKASEEKEFIEACRKTLYTGMICCVAQVFSLMKKASEQYNWNLDLYKIACALQGGTFVHSEIMYRVMDAFKGGSKTENILVNDYFSRIINEYCPVVRSTVVKIIEKGWPLPALLSTIEYIDCYRSRRLATPIIQIIKDCIAENGYERIDESGIFYGEWDNPNDIVKSVK